MRRLANFTFTGTHFAAILLMAAVPLQLLIQLLRCGVDGEMLRGVSARWPILLGNTAVVSGIAGLLALSVGLVLAVSIFRTNMVGKTFAKASLLLLLCLPTYATGSALLWSVGFSTYRESAVVAGVLYGLMLTPLAALILGVGLNQVDSTCEDQALLECGAAKVLWFVSLPLIRWSLCVAALLVVFISATDYYITDMLQVRTFAEEIYTQYALQGAAAMPILLSIPPLFVFAVLYALAFRYRPDRRALRASDLTNVHTFDLGEWRWVVSFVVVGAILLFAAIPVASTVNQIRADERLELASGVGAAGGVEPTSPPRRTSAFVISALATAPELLTSLWTCPAAASVCAFLGLGIAWLVLQARHTSGFYYTRWILVAIVVLAWCVPAPACGIALIQLLNRPGALGAIYDSPVVLIIGYVVRFLPLAVLLLVPAIERVPFELEDAARTEGCSSWEVQRFIYWPLSINHVALTWFIVLAYSYGEIACTVLIAPPDYVTLAVRFSSLMHLGAYRDPAVIVVMTVSAISIQGLLLYGVIRGFRGDRG
ncbi:MAG: iron ABC transporter permease [Planctomycetes bacterium]|nr:iron ABC transporter permease [Planctomycetota bacterium]